MTQQIFDSKNSLSDYQIKKLSTELTFPNCLVNDMLLFDFKTPRILLSSIVSFLPFLSLLQKNPGQLEKFEIKRVTLYMQKYAKYKQ